MGEPARKLDHGPHGAQPHTASGRRRAARVLPMHRREQTRRGEDTWTLDRIALWYRTRRD